MDEVKVDWNKDKCKWNVFFDNENHVCHYLDVKVFPQFRTWIEGGQHRGAVFFENARVDIKDDNGILTATIY